MTQKKQKRHGCAPMDAWSATISSTTCPKKSCRPPPNYPSKQPLSANCILILTQMGSVHAASAVPVSGNTGMTVANQLHTLQKRMKNGFVTSQFGCHHLFVHPGNALLTQLLALTGPQKRKKWIALKTILICTFLCRSAWPGSVPALKLFFRF
jgi:hypothetical protein